jgi:hypothetical protein
MSRIFANRQAATALLLCAVAHLAGCASLVSNAASDFADNLSAAVINQNDPETVRDGAPAYMLLLDSLIEGNPDDPAILAAAANLYASYGAVFADDPQRAARLTERARDYASRSLCESFEPACAWDERTYDEFEGSLAGLDDKHADVVYAYGVASLAWIRAHADDWAALARLPHMEALLNRYLEISDGEAAGTIYSYLGILVTLRPPALGGDFDKGRDYFERAIALSGGADLSAKVEYARGYARPLYERELHDRLLYEVLEADPNVDGYTLTNVLAQRDARTLLATADDHF